MPAEGEASPTLKRALGFPDLLLFGLVFMSPIGGFTLYGFVNAASDGAVIPSYILGAVGLGLTAFSYGIMAQTVPTAGSAYGYARLAMGRLLGFSAGWALVLDYVLISALVMMFGAIFLNASIPSIPVELAVAVFAAFSMTVNLLGIRWSAKVDIGVSGLQLAIVVIFIVGGAAAVIGGAGSGGFTTSPAWPEGADMAVVTSGATLALIGFLGFDAIATLAEEVDSPRPGVLIGRAALAAITVMMLVFMTVSWTLSELSVGLTLSDPSTDAFYIVDERLGWLSLPLSLTAAIALGVGVAVAGHLGVSRLTFAMAREQLLPRPLAHIHDRFRTPWIAVTATGAAITGIAFAVWYASGVDTLAEMVSFGALTGFLFVNASVIVHHGIRNRSRQWVRHWLLPALGMLVLVYILSGISRLALWLGLGWVVVGAVVFVARLVFAARLKDDREGGTGIRGSARRRLEAGRQ